MVGLSERERWMEVRKKISSCEEGGGEGKLCQLSAIFQATRCTTSMAAQGFSGSSGRFASRRGRKMGEVMM